MYCYILLKEKCKNIIESMWRNLKAKATHIISYKFQVTTSYIKCCNLHSHLTFSILLFLNKQHQSISKSFSAYVYYPKSCLQKGVLTKTVRVCLVFSWVCKYANCEGGNTLTSKLLVLYEYLVPECNDWN